MSNEKKSVFEQAAAKPDASLVAELLAMMKQNKKYWLIPLLALLLLFGMLIILGSTGAAPFIYTLF